MANFAVRDRLLTYKHALQPNKNMVTMSSLILEVGIVALQCFAGV